MYTYTVYTHTHIFENYIFDNETKYSKLKVFVTTRHFEACKSQPNVNKSQTYQVKVKFIVLLI